VWWDAAAAPLQTLAERVQAPVFLNGAGRGSLPPDHPLSFALARRAALQHADVIVLVGTKLDFRLNYGQPPLIPRETKISWMDTLAQEIGVNRGADVGIVGDVSAALAALAEAVGGAPDHAAWLGTLREKETKAREADEILMQSSA